MRLKRLAPILWAAAALVLMLGAAIKRTAGLAPALEAKPGALGVLPGAAMSRQRLSLSLPMNWRQSPRGKLVFSAS